MIIPISTMFGSIVINLSRNMVISSIVGIFYGFVSCMFIGADVGRLVPGAFAYRICMFILEQNTFYDDPIQSIKIGITSYLIVGFIVSLVAILIFNQEKKDREVENEKIIFRIVIELFAAGNKFSKCVCR